MEAGLPPTKDLSAKAVLAASLRWDKASEPLATEFALSAWGAWFVVLAPSGGLLDQFSADMAGAGCTKATVDRFPVIVAERIAAALKQDATIEELETRCLGKGGDASFAPVAGRLEAMQAFGRLRRLCDRVLAQEDLAAAFRAVVRRRCFSALSNDLLTTTAFEPKRPFIDLGIDLAREMKGSQELDAHLKTFFHVAFSRAFDAPSKAKDCAARLERDAGKACADAFRSIAEDFVSDAERRRSRSSGYGRAYAAAQLGDAEETIRFFSTKAYANNEYFKPWVAEAREKLARGGGKEY